MKHLPAGSIILLLASLCLVACKKKQTPSSEVRAAAEQYYGYLIDGNVDAYLHGFHDYDRLSETYRHQLRDMFRQYLQREQELHGGLASAQAVHDTLIDNQHAQVFVEITYHDNNREKVLLPLILTQEGWRLK